MMKRIFKVFLVLVLGVLFLGCSGVTGPNSNWDEEVVLKEDFTGLSNLPDGWVSISEGGGRCFIETTPQGYKYLVLEIGGSYSSIAVNTNRLNSFKKGDKARIECKIYYNNAGMDAAIGMGWDCFDFIEGKYGREKNRWVHLSYTTPIAYTPFLGKCYGHFVICGVSYYYKSFLRIDDVKIVRLINPENQ